MCHYCSRRVFDEGRPAEAGSDALRLHEFWDHLDLFQEVLEPEVVAAAAVKGAKRRGKRGKEARRSSKVKEAMETESAPEGNNQSVLQLQQLPQGSTAPYLAPLDPATTCTPRPLTLMSITGTPILAFSLKHGFHDGSCTSRGGESVG